MRIDDRAFHFTFSRLLNNVEKEAVGSGPDDWVAIKANR